MSVNEFAKILLVISLAFSLVGVSYQFMRFIGALADSIKDFRKTIRNLGDLTEKLNEDYDFISGHLKDLSESVGNIGRNVIDPITNIFSFLQRFKADDPLEDDIELEEESDPLYDNQQ